MSEIQAPPVETPAAPAAPSVPPPAATPEAPLSVLEHAQQFSPKQADETTEQAEERRHHSAEQRREKASGQFKEGKVRHRSPAQEASPADVPRIQQLTSRAKAAETRLQLAETELARLRAVQAPPAQIARAEARVEQTQAAAPPPSSGDGFKEAEPDEADPAFANDYAKYLRAVAKWEGRKAQWEWRQEEHQIQTQARRTAQQQQEMAAWGQRMDAAAAAYPDFHEVALQAPALWLMSTGDPIPIQQDPRTGQFLPSGAAIDAFIKEDDNGGHVLYHLQTHREEADALIRMAPIQQLKRLALLSQRFDASSASPQAGSTGSAAGPRLVTLPPKPPNPVRTEAQRTGTSPPPTDGSLSVMSHAKAFKRPY
jgi:hypothetical protein